MANRRKTIMDISEIIRRWQSGHSLRAISRDTRYDRGTISRYIRLAESKGINQDSKLTTEEIRELFPADTLPLTRVKSDKTDILLKHIDEFRELVNSKQNPLKAKSAFEILSEKYEFHSRVSYTTFKRFVRTQGIGKETKATTTCRIDIPLGSQIQVDYAKVGYLFDPNTGKKRTVYAFI